MEEQMSNRKKLQDLTIRDNFLFAAVMAQQENCKRFLEILLNIQIERIEISYEKSIIYNPEEISLELEAFLKFIREDTADSPINSGDSFIKGL